MTDATYEGLCLLYDRFGPREFGKLCQKLLAISYRQAGFQHVTERGVQGVDVDAAKGQTKFSTEVKTTVGNTILFQTKDAEGLSARQADGYEPLLGVLRLSPLADWLVVDAQLLSPGRLALDSLRPYRLCELEQQLRKLFDEAVAEHSEATLDGGQSYLDRALKTMGIGQEEKRR